MAYTIAIYGDYYMLYAAQKVLADKGYDFDGESNEINRKDRNPHTSGNFYLIVADQYYFFIGRDYESTPDDAYQLPDDWQRVLLLPRETIAVDNEDDDGAPEYATAPDNGINARDYFAAHALQALVYVRESKPNQIPEKHGDQHVREILCDRAYKYADAMLESKIKPF